MNQFLWAGVAVTTNGGGVAAEHLVLNEIVLNGHLAAHLADVNGKGSMERRQ